MDRRFLIALLSAGLFVPAVLFCDGPALSRQLLLGVVSLAFLYLFVRRSSVDRGQIVIAIMVATAGELMLSIGLGLYDYRHAALIPLYVPFGHGLFYALASESARQRVFQQNETGIVRGVLVSGTLIAATTLLWWNDQWGLVWWILAATLIARSRNALLLAICFVYTMLLEWTGTAMGNWQWIAEVPLVNLHSANPPSGVGILYVLLDLITVSIARARKTPAEAGAPLEPAEA
jgi:hypothetical protein